MTSLPAPGPARINALEESAALAVLHEVCAAPAWARRLLAARPFTTAEDLYAASDAATAGLTAEDLAAALAAHPPIGSPPPGDPVSVREQPGMSGVPGALREEMLALNRAYREKFGHVLLVCAAGRTGTELRDAARERIGNPPEREREVVRRELGRINRLRLGRLVGPDAPA
ncbi:2-oxo-4-hydroxy-4-carboxy-5-ureidoimidazoline decarboxylase [Streptomyces sp. NPDC052077]|uniref:2-oxo-4-hydroxy-4-carboxy-5-ureidoimidazoline decarboxylase n=1 Tax=Streptomyces sp. NPDC052077 TaxID=3154757 RepID=UPI0034232EED